MARLVHRYPYLDRLVHIQLTSPTNYRSSYQASPPDSVPHRPIPKDIRILSVLNRIFSTRRCSVGRWHHMTATNAYIRICVCVYETGVTIVQFPGLRIGLSILPRQSNTKIREFLVFVLCIPPTSYQTSTPQAIKKTNQEPRSRSWFPDPVNEY